MNRRLTGILVLALATGTAVAGQATDPTAQHAHDHATVPTAASAAVIAPQTEGEIRKVDVAAQKLTVKHGRIENLGMSPMTMAGTCTPTSCTRSMRPSGCSASALS